MRNYSVSTIVFLSAGFTTVSKQKLFGAFIIAIYDGSDEITIFEVTRKGDREK